MAIRSPLYGRYAYNLAVSVSSIDPSFPIAIIADEAGLGHLSREQRAVFRKIIKPDVVLSGTANKLLLDQYTPFDQTLFLDADTILSPYCDINAMFKRLNTIPFTMACRGESNDHSGKSDWVNLQQVKDVIDFRSWYDLSSEFIYFEKGDDSEKIFQFAREAFHENKIEVREFAGGNPDEPYFTIALIKSGVPPHQIPFLPSWWEPHYFKSKDRFMKPVDIYRNFFCISAGGKRLNKITENIYNNVAKIHGQKFGVKPFPAQHKDRVIDSRKLI